MENSSQSSAKTSSNWFRLISSPSQFFYNRRKKLTWVWPLIVASIVNAIILYLEIPFKMKMPQMLITSGRAPNIQNTTSLFANIIKTMAVLTGLISPWIAVIVSAFFIWVFIKLFGISIKFMRIFGILSNSYIITLIGAILTVIVTLATNAIPKDGFLSINEIFHFSGAIGATLATITVFGIWHLYVVIVGVSEIGTVSRKRALTAVLTIYVLELLFTALIAQVGGQMSTHVPANFLTR